MNRPSPSAAEQNNARKMRDKDMRYLAINVILISLTAVMLLNPATLINHVDTAPSVCLLSFTLLAVPFICLGLGFLLLYLSSRENKTEIMIRMQKVLEVTLASLLVIALCGFILQALTDLLELDGGSEADMRVLALTEGLLKPLQFVQSTTEGGKFHFLLCWISIYFFFEVEPENCTK